MPAPFRLVNEDGPTAARRETLPPAGRKCARSTRCAVHGWRIVGTPREGVNRDLPRPTSRRAHAARARDARVALEVEAPAPLDPAPDPDAGTGRDPVAGTPRRQVAQPQRAPGEVRSIAAACEAQGAPEIAGAARQPLGGHPTAAAAHELHHHARGQRRMRPARGRPGQIPVDTLAGRSYYPPSVHRAPR